MNNHNSKSFGFVCCNLANAITLGGILLCFVLQWVIFAHMDWTKVILILATGIILTDWIDGPVARYFKKNDYAGVSSLGAALDRLRDKIFQITMFLFFALHPSVDHQLKWAFCLLIVAEVLLLVTLFMGVKKKVDVSAANWGKYKMFLACVGILACIANIVAQEHGIKIPIFATYLMLCTLVASLCLAIMSIKGHVADYYR